MQVIDTGSSSTNPLPAAAPPGPASFLFPDPPRALSIGKTSEVSALTPIKRGRVPDERRTYEERLRFVVSTLANKLENGIPSELAQVRSLHFGRITIIRPEQYLAYLTKGGGLPADDYVETGPSAEPQGDGTTSQENYRTWVLTQVVFDGDIASYFREIAVVLNTKFDAIYENCEDYPGTANFEDFWSWIGRYQIQSDMFYVANPSLSVARIKQLEDFRRRFDIFLAKVRPPDGRRVEGLDSLFDAFLRETLQYASGFPASGGVYLGQVPAEAGQP